MSTVELPEPVAECLAAAKQPNGACSTSGHTAAEAEEMLDEGGFGIDSADR